MPNKMQKEPWEPRQRETEVIDPKDPDAARKFEMQRRGGAYSDRVRLDPNRMPPRRRSVRT